MNHKYLTRASGLTRRLVRWPCAREAGLPPINPHKFRHFVRTWLDSGGAEGDLMRLAGRRTRQMVGRHGASAAASRVRRAHERLSPGGQL